MVRTQASVMREASVTRRWTASTASSDNFPRLPWAPFTAYGESACLRFSQSLQLRAWRTSSVMAMRSAALHHVPGPARRVQADLDRGREAWPYRQEFARYFDLHVKVPTA
jgi:hypothetical protein